MNTPRYRPPPRSSRLTRTLKKLYYAGTSRFCVVCHSSVRAFLAYGHVSRADVRCPVCGCVERHRLTWQYFQTRTDLFDGRPKRMLHVGPEPEFERQLRKLKGLQYVTLDAQDTNADLCMNLEDLDLPSDHFDVIHCSHVLEHVSNDGAAIRELTRVLRPDGWATILVPIIAKRTLEDPSVTDPRERARLFGQWDHVRAYGPDFVDRLRAGGLRAVRVTAKELLPSPELESLYRFADEQLFVCSKQADHAGLGERLEHGAALAKAAPQFASLSADEKVALIKDLWNSLDFNTLAITSEQRKELDRRLDLLERSHSR